MTYDLRTTADEAERRAGNVCRQIIQVLTQGEEEYQDLVDAWQAAGSDNNKWARRLYSLARTDPTKLDIDATAKTVTCRTGANLFANWPIGRQVELSGFTNGGNNTTEVITARPNTDTLTMGESTTLVDETGGGDEVAELVATTEQATFVQHLQDAMTDIHELYGAMTNQATATADRVTTLRRFA